MADILWVAEAMNKGHRINNLNLLSISKNIIFVRKVLVGNADWDTTELNIWFVILQFNYFCYNFLTEQLKVFEEVENEYWKLQSEVCRSNEKID